MHCRAFKNDASLQPQPIGNPILLLQETMAEMADASLQLNNSGNSFGAHGRESVQVRSNLKILMLDFQLIKIIR